MKMLLATTAAAAALATTALAQPPAAPAVVPLKQAVAAAERAVGGKAFDAELDTEHGRLVYEISLVKDGRAVEAEIDPATGKLLRQNRSAPPLPWDSSSLKAAQSAPKSLTQTISMVETSTKGRVTDISLERRNERHYYEVELAGAQDREVRVDLQTGAITPVIDD
ncbi:PepSY domain-containing protein [Phenylobacterium sp. LjRoot219]|uniref:PepSY domain-containing protein n=1 Tax=Phenylobacterium sp. LjRoot219 TaxID=3342283 RepID=UPI003ECE1880